MLKKTILLFFILFFTLGQCQNILLHCDGEDNSYCYDVYELLQANQNYHVTISSHIRALENFDVVYTVSSENNCFSESEADLIADFLSDKNAVFFQTINSVNNCTEINQRIINQQLSEPDIEINISITDEDIGFGSFYNKYDYNHGLVRIAPNDISNVPVKAGTPGYISGVDIDSKLIVDEKGEPFGAIYGMGDTYGGKMIILGDTEWRYDENASNIIENFMDWLATPSLVATSIDVSDGYITIEGINGQISQSDNEIIAYVFDEYSVATVLTGGITNEDSTFSVSGADDRLTPRSYSVTLMQWDRENYVMLTTSNGVFTFDVSVERSSTERSVESSPVTISQPSTGTVSYNGITNCYMYVPLQLEIDPSVSATLTGSQWTLEVRTGANVDYTGDVFAPTTLVTATGFHQILPGLYDTYVVDESGNEVQGDSIRICATTSVNSPIGCMA